MWILIHAAYRKRVRIGIKGSTDAGCIDNEFYKNYLKRKSPLKLAKAYPLEHFFLIYASVH